MELPDEIRTWAAEKLTPWQLVALERIALRPLESADDADLLALCKKDAGLEPAPPEPTASTAATAPPSAPSTAGQRPGRLLTIGSPANVNALSTRHALRFQRDGLTVVYAGNGHGKSGFVRILKHACGARYVGTLHPNVFKGAGPAPSATIEYEVEGKAEQIRWTAPNRVAPLSSVAVFDANCGDLYVTDENKVAYEPGVVRLLRELVAASDRVATALRAEQAAFQSTLPTPDDTLRKTEAGRWYESLRWTPVSDADLERECTFSPEDQVRLDRLNAVIASAARAGRALELRAQAGQARTLLGDLKDYSTALSVTAATHLVELNKDYAEADAAALAAAAALTGHAKLLGIGAEPWRRMWVAARDYSLGAAYPGKPFPVTTKGALCPLCQQELAREACERMRAFEEHITGTLSQQAAQARKALEAARAALPSVVPEKDLLERVGAVLGGDATAAAAIVSYAERAREQRARLATLAGDADLASIADLDASCLAAMGLRAAELEAEAEEMERLVDETELSKVRAEAAALAGRKWVSEHATDARNEVARVRQHQKYDDAIRGAGTGQITRQSLEWAKRTVTDGLLTHFAREREALGATDLRVEVRREEGRKGEALHRLHLAGTTGASAGIREILSEGEFRVVALAAFLAYNLLRPDLETIVLDDPVCSLDLDYQERVAKRVVELAATKQVIVFTHSMTFLAHLFAEVDEQKAAEPALVELHRQGDTYVGEPAPYHHNPARPNLKEALHEIEGRVRAAEKVLMSEGVIEYRDLARGISTDMRRTAEAFVERVLLDGIVTRFEKDVRTKGMGARLLRIRPEDCTLLEQIMSRYSNQMHIEPLSEPVRPPEPKQFLDDIEALRRIRKEIEDRKHAGRASVAPKAPTSAGSAAGRTGSLPSPGRE